MSASTGHVAAGLSLRANFSWTFVGNIVYAASQWGMLVVLAKLGSPEMIGQFALGLAVTAPVIMFANLQLRNIQATDARREYMFGDYFGVRLITTALALLAIAGILLVARYRAETTLIVFTIGIAKSFEAISDVFYGLLQQHEKMDRVAKSMMIKGPLSLIAFGVAVYFTGSVLWAALGLAVVWAIILVCYDMRSGILILRAGCQRSENTVDKMHSWVGIIQPRWNIHILTKLISLALPLGFVGFLVSLNPNIPRYFIERQFGERELGVFAAMAYLIVAGNTVVSALAQSANPKLAKYYTTGQNAAFRALLLKLVGVGALLGMVGTLAALIAGQQILTLLYEAQYAEFAPVFVWIMVAAGVGYIASFLNYSMIATRHVMAQLSLFVLVTCTTVAVCFWLIPTYGLAGGAWALIISLVIHVIGGGMVNWYALNTGSPFMRDGEQ